MLYRTYLLHFQQALEYMEAAPSSAAEATARLVVDCRRAGDTIRVFASGRAPFLLSEAFNQAKDLIGAETFIDHWYTGLDGLSGSECAYGDFRARELLYRQGIAAQAGGLLIIVTEAGVSPVGLALAHESKRQGANIVVITPTSPSGFPGPPNEKILTDLADIVVTTAIPPTNPAEAHPQAREVAPLFPILELALVNAIIAEVVWLLQE